MTPSDQVRAVKMNRVHFSSQNDNWKTPEKFYEELKKEFHFDFDPCPENPDFDGLTINWGQRNFVNPPYSEIKMWLKKGAEESEYDKLIVFLIPSRTDTKWWHEYCMKATEIRFIKGRLRFQGAINSAPFPSCLVIFSNSLHGYLSKCCGVAIDNDYGAGCYRCSNCHIAQKILINKKL